MTLPYVEIEVAGVEVRKVLAMKGAERLGELFRYDVHAELVPPIPAEGAVIGAAIAITMRSRVGGERIVRGRITGATLRALDNDRVDARLVVRPDLFRQTLGRDCYASQDVTVRDVVDDVLADYTGRYRWELLRSYATYPYRVQYREDDWTYVSRFLEEEGIFVWFDHEAGSIAVFADDSRRADDIPGGALIPWVRGGMLTEEAEAVEELSFASAQTSGRHSIRSFDPARPQMTLEASAGGGNYEAYDAPGGGLTSEALLASRVRDAKEAATAASSTASGLARSTRLSPGRAFDVVGHPLPKLDGRWFITSCEVSGTDELPCTTRFTALRGDVSYRPPRATPLAQQAGLQMGLVVGADGEEVHPDESGRIRVIQRWDRLGSRNEKGGTWMRVAQRGAPGSMLLPRMGWNVATFNEEGGVDAPSTVCRIHDGEHPPTYPLPGNMTRVVYKTATSPSEGTHNEVHFEDRLGAEEMFINASRDMTIRIRDAKFEVVKNDSFRKVGNVHDVQVGESMNERIIGNQTVNIGSNQKLETQAELGENIAANSVETIAGSRKLKVGKSFEARIRGSRQLGVGGAMIDLTLGEVTRIGTDVATLVGGAVVKIAADTITEGAGKVSVQAVGGAKIEIAKEDRQLSVRKNLLEAVGGAMLLKSNGTFQDNADKTSSWKVGGPLTGKAPEIRVEAIEKLSIKCGASVLTLTKDSIELKATQVDLSAAHLDADTGAIDHN